MRLMRSVAAVAALAMVAKEGLCRWLRAHPGGKDHALIEAVAAQDGLTLAALTLGLAVAGSAPGDQYLTVSC